jgi:hypothetical protein
MMPYRWTINGATFDDAKPLLVERDERVRLQFVNRSTMFHPMHVHGHTFALTGGGARKDTVTVAQKQTRHRRPRRHQPRPVGDPLPQHLPRRGRHDDQPGVPGMTAARPDRTDRSPTRANPRRGDYLLGCSSRPR